MHGIAALHACAQSKAEGSEDAGAAAIVLVLRAAIAHRPCFAAFLFPRKERNMGKAGGGEGGPGDTKAAGPQRPKGGRGSGSEMEGQEYSSGFRAGGACRWAMAMAMAMPCRADRPVSL